MSVLTTHALFYTLLVLATLLTLILLANPYRVRARTEHLVDSLLPEAMQREMMTLADAWRGQVKLTSAQVTMLSIAGAVVGVFVGVLIGWLTEPGLGILLGLLAGGVLSYYPRDTFVGGFPKASLAELENEAALLASFMYQAIAMSRLTTQQAFARFAEMYADTQTAVLITQAPTTIAYTAALLDLDLPASRTANWLEVVETMAALIDLGNPGELLASLRSRMQTRQEQALRRLAKKKAFQAPIVTVLLLLLPLMGLILIPVIVQAAATLGGLS